LQRYASTVARYCSKLSDDMEALSLIPEKLRKTKPSGRRGGGKSRVFRALCESGKGKRWTPEKAQNSLPAEGQGPEVRAQRWEGGKIGPGLKGRKKGGMGGEDKKRIASLRKLKIKEPPVKGKESNQFF